MSKGSGARPDDDMFVRGARRLAEWMVEYRYPLETMVEMRELGPDGREALDGLLEVRMVKAMRLAWEFWEHLGWLEGVDTEQYLRAAMSADLLKLGRMALWGTPGPRLRSLS